MRIIDSRIRAPITDTESRPLSGDLKAVNSEFDPLTSSLNSDMYFIRTKIAELEGCEFEAPAKFGNATTENCDFKRGLEVMDKYASTIRNSTIAGLRIHPQRSGQPGTVVESSTLTPIDSNTALRIPAPNSKGSDIIRNCIIKGKVDITGDEEAAHRTAAGQFIGNKFENEGNFDFFVRGGVAQRYVANAFIGADVQIDYDWVQMYSEEKQLGNYYSAWEGQDSNADGIIDKPRPIPGDGTATDRYPLSTPQLDEYL